MSILYIVLLFIGVLIVFYVVLAFCFFGRNYKIKTDKLFSDAVRSILENPETDVAKQTQNTSDDRISIKKLLEKNSNFKYLKGDQQNVEAKSE